MSDHLQNIISRANSVIDEIKTSHDETRTNVSAIRSQIENIRRKMIESFDSKTKQIVMSVGNVSEGLESEDKAVILNLEKLLKSAEGHKDFFETLTENGEPEDVFRCLISLLQQLEKYKTTIEKVKEDCHQQRLVIKKTDLLESLESNEKPLVEYYVEKTKMKCFTPVQGMSTDQELKNHIALLCASSSDNNLCLLERKAVSDMFSPSKNHEFSSTTKDSEAESGTTKSFFEAYMSSCDDTEKQEGDEASNANGQDTRKIKGGGRQKYCEAELTHGYTFSVKSDKQIPWFGGLVCLTDERLMLADFHNSCLILLSDNTEILMTKSLDFAPGHMAILKEDCIAVCLMKTNQILLVDVQNNELIEKKYVQTPHHPKCVQSVENDMIVSCQDFDGGWYLYIMTTQGKIQKQIIISGLLDCFRFAVQNLHSGTIDCRIIQCCQVTNKLQCFESDGSFVFSYNTDRPSFVLTDSRGYIFLIRFTGEIQVLSPDGQFLYKLHRQALLKAKSATFNYSMDKLFITTYKDNKIIVVNVKRRKED